MNVEWKEINPDYIVSSDGRVGSRKRGGLKLLKPGRDTYGYLIVSLHDGHGGRRTTKVHQLVAEAFIGPKPTPLHQINHINGVKDDPRASNLEWVTASENHRHRFAVLGQKAAHGEAQGLSKLTEAKVRDIRAQLAARVPQKVIAAAHGIDPSNVSWIARRKSWAWLT